MDLRLNAATARSAVIWILNCLGAILLLWATASYGSSDSPGRDYLYSSEVGQTYLESPSQLQSSRSSSKTLVSSAYKSFDGQSYDLVEYRGHYVSVLLSEAVGDNPYFTADHVEEMLDRLDVLYTLYRELLHVEPTGSGLLKIAFVPETCGMGCGLIGAKGIEIKSHPLNYENIVRELDAGRLETILIHEMVHNFDRFSDYLHYLPDHAHAWTDMFEFFAPYRYARDVQNNESPDDIYNSPVRAVWKDYVSDETADWETCVRDQGCEASGLRANHLWAMLYYRIETMHGVDALLESFRFISGYVSKNPAPRTNEEKEGLRILSLAVGVGANIACYMDSLRWPVPASVRAEMEQRFGKSGAFCADADQDGFTLVNGDCADDDPGRNILSAEIPNNGRDDDCDELIDEQNLVEAQQGNNPDNFVGAVQSELPAEIAGSASDSEDIDRFQFALTPSKRARITLCADDEFVGWAVAAQPDGSFLEAPNWNTYQANAGCSSNTYDYGSFSSGGLIVMPDESKGDYSLTVSEAAPLPPDYSVYLSVVPRSSGGVSVEFDDRDALFAGLGADEVDFWVSGVGMQLFRSFSPQLSVPLTVANSPRLVDGEMYQVRVRPRANGKPLAAFSAGHLFRYQTVPTIPVIDSSYSGLWYDPEHDGEGFIVEVLADDRALVYWFSYHADGRQRWFIGVGEVQGSRIVIDEMLDTHGGRFGENFDPDDVQLQDRGSLSISFNSCTEALVNYSIDKNAGHLPLQRLTGVHGHACGKADTAPALDFSGSWYDPSHDGEGFIVQQFSASEAIAFYFTYDSSGNQAWLFNTGTVAGNRLSFPELLQPVGGQFGRSYDPKTVDARHWGDLELELDCKRGPATYSSSGKGFSDGSQSLVRLTRLQGSGCTP